ncbi:hypothetical protein ANRL1_02902 [Anaerolineae bacterium]|nr:hypothetical protein ANRL1_02902 [Anaerolineae bacterium]
MSGKLALIIGTSDYQDPGLHDLAAPIEDARDLAEALRDPAIGGFDDVMPLINAPAQTIRKSIARLFKDRAPDDLLLLYFSGHGVLDEQGQLYLTAADTERSLLSGTAIPAAFVSGEMDRSRSRRQVLVLDCCHSGAFEKGSKGALGASVGTKTVFGGSGYGRIVLTATDATQYAWEGNKVIGDAIENSLFTHYLLEGLRTGQADSDGDGHISVEEMYDYAARRVIEQTAKQKPYMWRFEKEGTFIIARNPKPRAVEPVPLDAALQAVIDNPYPLIRKGAVQELERLLNGSNAGLAVSAFDALQRLSDDDSDSVRAAAAAVVKDYQERHKVAAQPSNIAHTTQRVKPVRVTPPDRVAVPSGALKTPVARMSGLPDDVRALAESPDRTLRMQAIEKLKRLLGHADAKLAGLAFDRLRQLTDDPEVLVQKRAKDALEAFIAQARSHDAPAGPQMAGRLISGAPVKAKPAEPSRPPEPSAAATTDEVIFEPVWYWNGEIRWLSWNAYNDSGKLIVRRDRLEYHGSKTGVLVIQNVRAVSESSSLKNSWSWVKVEYGRQQAPQIAYYADGRYMGYASMFGGNKTMLEAIRQLVNVPE